MQRSTPQLEIVFDYVDPGSFVVQLLLERWPVQLEQVATRPAASGGRFTPAAPTASPDPAPVAWLPLELAPPASPPLDGRDPAWVALTHAMQGVARDLGISTAPPPFLPRTRKAHELALHAAENGAYSRVHRALFRAHFEEGRDLGRVDVLVAVAAAEGLDPAEARTVLGVDRFRGALEDQRADLLGQGVRGVPTLRTPDGARLDGFQETDVLTRFLDEHLSGAVHPVPPATERTSEE